MASYGVTPQGFVPEPLAQSQQDIIAAMQGAFGADIDTSPNGPFGILAAIMADRESTAGWQMGQAVYGAAYPDTASGSQLDDVCSMTGVVRLAATKSTGSEVLIGANGTIVGSGTIFATATSGVQFATAVGVTIATLAAWLANTTTVIGALLTNGGNIYSCTVPGTTAVSTAWAQSTAYVVGNQRVANGNLYTCASNGTSLGSGTGPSGTGSGIVDNTCTWNYTSAAGGPTGTGTAILDNNVVWYYCGAGTAAVAASVAGIATGPLAAPVGTLTVISTPVAGLTSVTNPLAAVQGTNLETDAALRLRRTLLLQVVGRSPIAAMQAALIKTAGVTGAQVFENSGDVVDGSGRPPHSVECVVSGGADAAVAATIWQSKAAGIQTTGSYTPQNVTDPVTGVVYSITFTRPTSVPIYVTVNLTRGATYGGDTAVKQAIIDYVTAASGTLATEVLGDVVFAPGQTVYAGPLSAAILDEVGGILDIASVRIGLAPSPGASTPLAMAFNQVATFDVSRITVP